MSSETTTTRLPCYLGIDLGGTNVKAGVVDDQGRVLSSLSGPTEAVRGPDAGVTTLARLGRKAVDQSGVGWDHIAGVGLGSPGFMNIAAGMLLNPPNLPGWDDFPLRDRVADALGRPVAFQNDANAAAFGESWVGAGRGARSLVLFTLGTGVGCGIVLDGQIVEGRHSHGAECGHQVIQMDGGRLCPCGQYGHLEAYASATALVQRAIEALAESDEPTPLRKRLAENELTARSIDEAADAGDSLARRLMVETARYLAVGAINVMHTIDPDLVLFGGGMTASGPVLIDNIRTFIRSLAFPTLAREVRVEYATLGGDAGFIGAAGWARWTAAHLKR
jgi:glucokinase